jgi:hypothetical protein
VEAAIENLRGLKKYPAMSVDPGEECDAALRALADHYAATGRTDAAIHTSADLLAKLMASKPQPLEDLRHANSLARLYGDFGKLKLRAGLTAEAQELFERQLSLWRYWDRKLPDNEFVKHKLAAL